MNIFEDRSLDAVRRVGLLRASLSTKLADIPASDRHPTLCIYATGSLARLEANAESDLDAFFMLSGNDRDHPIGRIRDVRILNAVLESADEAKFPDFSNDGQYLKFLHIEAVLEHIGSREDDYLNAFTARMLMLLESTYLFNKSQYNVFQQQIIDVYFSDFHRHSTDFKPIFLINDVVRFWRTLCLNYENGRHWRNADTELDRASGHLGNLKLKFSRLNICYSFICHLFHQGPALTRENAIHTAQLTPFQRLDEIASGSSELKNIVDSMRCEYSWFLEATARPKDETLSWILNEENRNNAFNHANKFVQLVVDLTTSIATKNNYLRYLIV